MATAAENLQTALTNIATQIEEMTRSPKPTYSENGRSVSWGEHFNSLISAQKAIREELQRAGGPVTSFA